MGASLEERLSQRNSETVHRLGTLAAKRAFHQLDKVQTGALRLLAQIGFAVAKTIHRGLLPAAFLPAFDGEDIEPTLFQPLRNAGKNDREIADVDHGVGRKNKIVTVSGLRKRHLDIAQDEIVVNATTTRC